VVIQIFARLLTLQLLGFPAVWWFKPKRQRLQMEEGEERTNWISPKVNTALWKLGWL